MSSSSLLDELRHVPGAREDIAEALASAGVCARVMLGAFELAFDHAAQEVLIEDTRTPGRSTRVSFADLSHALR